MILRMPMLTVNGESTDESVRVHYGVMGGDEAEPSPAGSR